ncbi:MAG: OmpA family protein [Paracoccaceae bacterium]
MKLNTKALLMVAALLLAACSNNGRFGGGFGGAAGGLNGAGEASDPTSIAYFQQSVGDRVLFSVDQHTLTPAATALLDQQAIWLMNSVEFTAIIEGHADEQGTSAYNLALSGRRANSVIEYLVGRGVSPARLQPLPLGKERPIAICSEEICYSQNRRAVTIVVARGLS